MSSLETPVALWSVFGVQMIGLAVAWMTRLTEGSCYQAPCQCLFLGCLGLVGLSAVLGTSLGQGSLLTSGATLAVMVLAATCDFRRASLAT